VGVSKTLKKAQNLWNFELAHARTEEDAKPRFESQPGMEYELREDGSQSRRVLASGV